MKVIKNQNVTHCSRYDKGMDKPRLLEGHTGKNKPHNGIENSSLTRGKGRNYLTPRSSAQRGLLVDLVAGMVPS